MATQPALYISKCLLKIADEGDNNDMTNMKLQKLLYYAQGTSIALYDRKLFNEDIYKWQYGPVVPNVYHHYKIHGSGIIPASDVDLSTLDEKQIDILEDVYDFFGQFSAIKLMNLTHSESPWQEADMDGIIGESSLKDFFNTIVVKG